jgi:tRNA (guanine37-N1)-methyltransferase
VLLSGNHQEVARWRLEQMLARTRERRPDLLE